MTATVTAGMTQLGFKFRQRQIVSRTLTYGPQRFSRIPLATSLTYTVQTFGQSQRRSSPGAKKYTSNSLLARLQADTRSTFTCLTHHIAAVRIIQKTFCRKLRLMIPYVRRDTAD